MREREKFGRLEGCGRRIGAEHLICGDLGKSWDNLGKFEIGAEKVKFY